MPDYSNYNAEDLLLDESFLNYCKNSPADKAFWEAWLVSHPEMKAEIGQAKKIFDLLSVSIPAEEKLAADSRLRAAIAADSQFQTETSTAPIRPIATGARSRMFKLAAAAITVGIIISVALWLTRSNKYDRPAADFAKASFKQTIIANDSPRKQVVLPDGSVATLNSGSLLKISADYNASTRWVYLEGEAFFSVKPDAQKPFVVITSKTATSALGTSFKVRNYAGEDVSNVMLATGKVKVQPMIGTNQQDVILLPGEQATCRKDNSLVKSGFQPELIGQWRAMQIVFDKASLQDIVGALEFYYGVRVRLQNKPASEIAFTGKFSGKSLKEVLEAISFTNKFRYTETANTVSILFQ